ncbi:MAG: outer membrane lipoprotein-sorting protein [Stenotrophobium sp.]
MKKTLALLLAAVSIVSISAHAADAATTKVLDCMRANIPETLRVQEFDLTAIDRVGGTRALRGRLYAMRENGLIRALVKMLAPADLARAAYLIRENKAGQDDMWVYLPALDRVRRITGASAGGPLFGTDISYADVKQIENSFSGGAISLEKNETLQNRPVYVLAMKPAPKEQSRYSLVRGWIDQKTCMALKVDFHEGSDIRKQLTGNAADLKQDHGHWYLAAAEMRDLKDGTKTTFKITGVSSGDKLNTRYFNPATFTTTE